MDLCSGSPHNGEEENAVIVFGVHPQRCSVDQIERDRCDFAFLYLSLRVVIYYISLLVFPHPSRLNLDRDFPLSHSLTDPVTTLLSLLTIVGLIGFAVYRAKRQPLLSFCILWFLGNLVIESSVIALDLIFEHRTYLHSMMAILMGVMLVY
jgi:hypothetical protein